MTSPDSWSKAPSLFSNGVLQCKIPERVEFYGMKPDFDKWGMVSPIFVVPDVVLNSNYSFLRAEPTVGTRRRTRDALASTMGEYELNSCLLKTYVQ